jgi:hypothetical protein
MILSIMITGPVELGKDKIRLKSFGKGPKFKNVSQFNVRVCHSYCTELHCLTLHRSVLSLIQNHYLSSSAFLHFRQSVSQSSCLA